MEASDGQRDPVSFAGPGESIKAPSQNSAVADFIHVVLLIFFQFTQSSCTNAKHNPYCANVYLFTSILNNVFAVDNLVWL
jgi:hypothetical protein